MMTDAGTQVMSTTDAAVDAMIDAALASYPLAALPPGFTARAMARAVAVPRPRLQTLDVFLPAAVAGSAVVAMALGAWLTATDPLWWPRLALQIQLAWLALLPGVPLPGTAFWTLTVVVVGLAVLGATAARPRSWVAASPR